MPTAALKLRMGSTIKMAPSCMLRYLQKCRSALQKFENAFQGLKAVSHYADNGRPVG